MGTVLTNQNGSSLLASQSIRYTPGKDTVSSVITKLYDQEVKRSVTYGYTYGEAAEGEIPDTLYGFTVDGRRVSFTYDPLARLSQRSFALSGTTKTQIYYYEISDDLNDTTFVSGFRDMLGNSYGFTYDKNGNITNDGSYYYCYDAIGQLVEVGDFVDYKEYVYDDRGNIRQKLIYNSDFDLVDSVVYGYGNSTWTDALTSYDGESFSYDAMGNPLNWTGGRTLTWSNGRNLASMGGVTFTYDADGLRTGKTSSSKSTAYYALNGKYVGEKTVINGTSYYISYYYDENGAPMGVNVNGSAYFFVKNLQGDITAIMSYTGTVVAKYTYDAWGKLLSVRDGNNATVSNAAHIANLNPFRYRGYIYDTETGLYYVSSRYYDSEIGRWINADNQLSTGRDLTGMNLFAYCGNNPVNRIDPTGHFWITALIVTAVVTVCTVTLSGCSAKPDPAPLPYKTADEAAMAFANSTYSSSSYIRHEYGTVIYSSTTNGTTTYDFATPVACSPHSVGYGNVKIPSGTTKVATAHTHPNSNIFSGLTPGATSGDIPNAIRRGLDSYVIGPNLNLQKYSISSGAVSVVGVASPVALTSQQQAALVSQFQISWDNHLGTCAFGCEHMTWPTP